MKTGTGGRGGLITSWQWTKTTNSSAPPKKDFTRQWENLNIRLLMCRVVPLQIDSLFFFFFLLLLLDFFSLKKKRISNDFYDPIFFPLFFWAHPLIIGTRGTGRWRKLPSDNKKRKKIKKKKTKRNEKKTRNDFPLFLFVPMLLMSRFLYTQTTHPHCVHQIKQAIYSKFLWVRSFVGLKSRSLLILQANRDRFLSSNANCDAHIT